MKKIFYYHTLALVLLFIQKDVMAQKKYVQKANASQVSLEGKSLQGYTTNFDFSREEMRRGWWEYARAFGSPLNMKTYYKVTVPADINDGNVDLEIYTQTTDGKGGSDFFLGLENEKYKDQALTMILDFKKEFYIKDLVKQIEAKQKEADDLSDEYRKVILDSEKNQLLDKLIIVGKSIEKLKKQVKEIESM